MSAESRLRERLIVAIDHAIAGVAESGVPDYEKHLPAMGPFLHDVKRALEAAVRPEHLICGFKCNRCGEEHKIALPPLPEEIKSRKDDIRGTDSDVFGLPTRG